MAWCVRRSHLAAAFPLSSVHYGSIIDQMATCGSNSEEGACTRGLGRMDSLEWNNLNLDLIRSAMKGKLWSVIRDKPGCVKGGAKKFWMRIMLADLSSRCRQKNRRW